MNRPRYNPACDTCTYAWCCGRCYCCHPGPVFRIVDPAPVVVDETPTTLAGGLVVPAWVADWIEDDERG